MDKFANISITQALEVIGNSAEQLVESLCARAENSTNVAFEQSRKGAAAQLAASNLSALLLPEPNLDEDEKEYSIPVYAKPLADSEGAIDVINKYLKTLIGVEGKFVLSEVNEPDVDSFYLSNLYSGLDLQTSPNVARRKSSTPDVYGRIVIPNELSVCDLYALHEETVLHFGERMNKLLKKMIAKDKFVGTDYDNGHVDELRAAFALWSKASATLDIEFDGDLITALTDEAIETMTKALAELPDETALIIQQALIKHEFTEGLREKATKKIKSALKDQPQGVVTAELLALVDKVRERDDYDYDDHMLWQLVRIDFRSLARTYMVTCAPFKGTVKPEQWDSVSWLNVPTRG